MTIPLKKLAVLLPSLYGGGAERVMLRVAQGIAERGHSVDLVLTKMDGPYLDEVPESVNIVDLKASRVLTSLPSLIRYLRTEKPDTMVSGLHTNIPAIWARSFAGVDTRIVVTEHNTLSSAVRHAKDLRVRLAPRLIKRFYLWADAIVAVSEGVADDLSRVTGIPRDRVEVLYNPVITPELMKNAKALFEHPWFNPGEPPVILAMGRLTTQKDFHTLIEAFARVREARKAHLLILGEGEDRTSIEALVKQLGLEQDVLLPGFVVNPYPYLAGASVFVLSSKWEGLPTVLIEALFCGPIIVSTDCPSGPKEILRDGQYGQLVPVEDSAAMAQAIEGALAGRVPHPPEESWEPFELNNAIDRYIRVLFEYQQGTH